MEFMSLGWLGALLAIGVSIVAVLLLRKRTVVKQTAPDTFQDMSIFDEEVASGNYEIDPVTEAEVYLAYGNKKQALTLLLKAASDHPDRQDIQNKIREIDAGWTPAKR